MSGRNVFYPGVALLSDLTAAYCFFLLLTGTSARSEGIMGFSVSVYLACGLLALLVNSALAARERTLPVIAGVNIFLSALTAVLVFLAPNGITGIWAHAVAAAVFIFPAPRALSLCRGRADADLMLTYSELSIAGTSLYFLFQLGDFAAGPAANALCLISLVLNLVSLSSLRMEGALKIRGSTAERARRFFVLTLVAVLILGLAALLAVLLPGSREFVLETGALLWRGFVGVLLAIWHAIEALMALIPYDEIQSFEMEPEAAAGLVGETEYESTQLPLAAVVAAAALIAGLIAAATVYFIYRFRKLKIGAVSAAGPVIRQRSRAPGLFFIFAAFLKSLARRLRLLCLLILGYNTSAGIFVRLELRGKRRGVPRKKSQTPREYISALTRSIEPGNETAREALAELARELDLQLFGEKEIGRRESRRRLAKVIFSAVR